MNATQWAEFAGLGFALAVLAWVIYRKEDNEMVYLDEVDG